MASYLYLRYELLADCIQLLNAFLHEQQEHHSGNTIGIACKIKSKAWHALVRTFP